MQWPISIPPLSRDSNPRGNIEFYNEAKFNVGLRLVQCSVEKSNRTQTRGKLKFNKNTNALKFALL